MFTSLEGFSSLPVEVCNMEGGENMDVSKLFKGQKLEIHCPNCQKEFSIDAGIAFKKGSTVTCPHCNSKIKLDNSDSIKSIEKELNKLKNLFK
jgi:DNA-directed RNA polymerase subunit RPC12/RpoP